MKQVRSTRLTLQQSSQIQELIIVPILTLLFLSLVVRTASSAVDPTLEKRKITEQLKRRLSEVQKDREIQTISHGVTNHSLPIRERKEDSGLAFLRKAPPVTVVWRAVGGRIERSLYEAAITAGAPARIVDDLADLDWDLDFSSDLQPGDIFKVIFEEFQQDGKAIKYGQLLAAEIVNKGKVIIRFSIMGEKKSEGGSYAAHRQFLRYPLQFTRISSVFTDARLHPILHRVRPHLGVDFAAPTGTPVRVVASGQVIQAGWMGGFGKCIRIDHPGPFDSFYAHLQRLAKGLKTGATVERGQVIGYVGATGLATGSHLHFALFRDGQYVNPLSAKLPLMEAKMQQAPSPAIAEKKRLLSEQLAALKVERQTVSLVRPVSEALSAVLRKTAQSDGQPPHLLTAARLAQAGAR